MKIEAAKRRAAQAGGDPGRQRRIAAINKIFGLWKNRSDTPKDGLQYQEESRAE